MQKTNLWGEMNFFLSFGLSSKTLFRLPVLPPPPFKHIGATIFHD